MKFLLVLLIFLSFLQGAFSSLELVILILISRSFIVEERTNYYWAFFLGLLLSLLLNQPLGILSLIYLVAIKITYIIKRTSISGHWLVILPISLILVLAIELASVVIFKSSFSIWSIIFQSLLSLPIYLILRVWEERFIPKKEIRLKVGK